MKYHFIQNTDNLKALPEPWKIIAFDKIFKDVSSGNKRVKKSEVNNEGKYPVIDQGQEFIAGFTNDEKALIKTPPPHIVFGDHTRIFKFIEFPFIIGADGTKCLKIIDENINDAKYLYYFLRTLNIPNTGYNRHYKYLKEAKIPLPPLPIQERIASILDDAAALRDKTEQLLSEYDLLAQSLFLEMFGDLSGNILPLSHCCEINPTKSEIKDIDKETEVSFLPMKDVGEDGSLSLNEVRKIKEVWTGYTYFQSDDVILAKITPCMENGKSTILKNMVNGIGFGSTEFHVLRPIKGLSTSAWIFHLIRSNNFRKIAEQNMRGSAGQKRVPTFFFDNFKVNLTSIDLQNQFAEKIRFIERQKEIVRQELKESEDLFQALLQQAFRGELV